MENYHLLATKQNLDCIKNMFPKDKAEEGKSILQRPRTVKILSNSLSELRI